MVVGLAITVYNFCFVELFDAYFSQAVFGIVVVMLGGADGLFGLGSAVLVIAVVVTSEMQELVTANQVVIAVVLSVFAVQQVGSGIVLQGFPVSLVAAAFDSAGDIVFLNYISIINFFSLLISLINRGISCRACAINS